ncbi:MAG: hypothetical protein H7Z19_05895 [Chitinophagaceae bacterium]|nr:hypothetical protein [Rubrivivax sp.]
MLALMPSLPMATGTPAFFSIFKLARWLATSRAWSRGVHRRLEKRRPFCVALARITARPTWPAEGLA